MSWTVPLTEVEVTEDDVAAVLACYESGWLTMGPRTAELESRLAAHTGSPHAVATASGTAALHLACRAAGLGPGDEVIVPTMTFVASAHAPSFCGATVVLADSTAADDPTVSVADVERRVTGRTRAVVAVDLFGHAADLAGLRAVCDRHGLVLIEDMAQALGARSVDGAGCGTRSDLACVSFFSKKQLCVGEGGAVLTGSAEYAARVRSLRSHAMTSGTWDRHRGHEESYDVVDLGYNYRLDEPRAALALSRLERLDEHVAARRRTVRRYRERLTGVAGLSLLGDDALERSSPFAFPVVAGSPGARVTLRAGLTARGVQTTRYPALHTLTAFAVDDPQAAGLAVADAFADRHLCLPLWAHQDDDVVDGVCDAVRAVLAGR